MSVLAILRYYCFITQNMDHLHLNLKRHDIERTDLFGHLMNSHAFQDNIRPFDRRISTKNLPDIPISPEDIPLPTSNESSNPSIPVTVPIHDHASSSLSSFDENKSLNKSLDYHTALTNPHDRVNEPVHNQSITPDSPLGSQEHPINIDDIPEVLIPNIVPNDPSIDGFLHYL